jgi:diguanylate cyclase (GGDEF)-like protein
MQLHSSTRYGRLLDRRGLLLALVLGLSSFSSSTAQPTQTEDNVPVGPVVALSKAERDWIRDHPVIRIGVDPEFAPYEFVSEDGRFSGIASDYIKLLNERLGMNMEMVPNLSWPEVVARAERGEIDLLSAVGITEERKRFLRFSEPYISFNRVIITRDDAPFVSGLADLQNWRIGVQVNTSHEGFLLEHTQLQPETFESLETAIGALSDGQVDALVGNIGSATYWIRELNITNLQVAASVSTEPQHLHFAVRQDWPILLRVLNKGLASISAADRNRIQKRWFSVDYEMGVPMRRVIGYLLQLAALMLLVVVGFVAWNYRLKQEIKRRQTAVADLVRSEHKYRNLFNSSPDALLVADENGFIDCNAAALELYRCGSLAEFLALPIGSLSPPVQKDGTVSADQVRKVLALARSGRNQRFEWDSRRLDGTDFRAEITLSAIEIGGRSVVQSLVQDITERQKSEERIRYLANHDDLTGLPSLRLFQDRLDTALARAIREQSILAVLFIDLDGFKAINDTWGHAAGDQVLRSVADRMVDCVRRADTVARTGGDEFVILLPEPNSEKGAVTTARKVIETANLPIDFEGQTLHVGASIGIALYPVHGTTTEDLLKQADHAMYRAKDAGKNAFRVAQTGAQDAPTKPVSSG